MDLSILCSLTSSSLGVNLLPFKVLKIIPNSFKSQYPLI